MSGADTQALRTLMESWLERANEAYPNGLVAKAIDHCAHDLLKLIEAAEDDADDEFLPPPVEKVHTAIPRPVWLIGPEPDWHALADCWWGEAGADECTYDDCEEAIHELVAQMDAENLDDELDVEARRTAVIAADDPRLCPLTLAEQTIEALNEEFKWHEDYEPNSGEADIQDAARVFYDAVRRHYSVGVVGPAVATVRVDLRKWVMAEEPELAADLGWVRP